MLVIHTRGPLDHIATLTPAYRTRPLEGKRGKEGKRRGRGGEEEGGSLRRRRSVFERGFLDIARGALARREGLRATAVASEEHNSIYISYTPKKA